MASFKFSSFMTIFFLVISYSFNVCHADRALIDSICKPSEDYAFCISPVGNDPRAANADLHGLTLVSFSVTAIYIQDTLDKIYNLVQQLKDPVSQTRLKLCQSDYNEALSYFQSSFTATSRDAFFEATDSVRIGTNKVKDCHNRFMSNSAPLAISPIAGDDANVLKFSGIILIAIDKLIPNK
ncbi:pectinesterase inhibitor 5-like [Hibiscus syriacus]|uniref:pectinesterase inhibitor 5-like n=1 Tax=Hibiscus syriacus TaxID=106335 RepID=UPI0019244884|nr:pectinesterase inhibitor 5-like [Hibiscus syriacus]